jgi:hypothetical protein
MRSKRDLPERGLHLFQKERLGSVPAPMSISIGYKLFKLWRHDRTEEPGIPKSYLCVVFSSFPK